MSLLNSEDPPPFTEYNINGKSDILFTSDHNGVAIPANLNGLGVAPWEMGRHVAYDIGIDAVTKVLSDRFDAPLIVSNYSRLVIDCNRHPGRLGSIPPVSDKTVIPGNRFVSGFDKLAREKEIFHPYHKRISDQIKTIRGQNNGNGPIIIALHSFTPVINGIFRPWDIGILWKDDDRLAQPLIKELRTNKAIIIGDNKPYSGCDPAGYTTDFHVAPLGLVAVGVEFRQDRVDHQIGAEYWGKIFGDALERVLSFRPWKG